MTIKQMRKFAEKCYGEPIGVYYFAEKDTPEYFRPGRVMAYAWVDRKDWRTGNNLLAVFINKSIVCELSKVVLQDTILHELGHIALWWKHRRVVFGSRRNADGKIIKYSTQVSIVSLSRAEYEAQRWGIRKARELGMTNVAKSGGEAFTEDWRRGSWHKNRIYRIAANIAQKEGWE